MQKSLHLTAVNAVREDMVLVDCAQYWPTVDYTHRERTLGTKRTPEMKDIPPCSSSTPVLVVEGNISRLLQEEF